MNKKFMKRVGITLAFAGGGSVFGVATALVSNAYISGLATDLTTPGLGWGSLSIGQTYGVMFFIGLVIGIGIIVWYPISRLLAWAKTRKLKNSNMEADLKIKEAKLEQIKNPQNNPNNTPIIEEDTTTTI